MIHALLLASATMSAGGQETAGQPDARSQRMICRSENDTGSRVRGSRICRTAAEWDEERRAARDFTTSRQSRGLDNIEANALGGGVSNLERRGGSTPQ
jgi:hypothetical protein